MNEAVTSANVLHSVESFLTKRHVFISGTKRNIAYLQYSRASFILETTNNLHQLRY